MTPGRTTCGFSGCGIPICANTFTTTPCLACLHVPDDDFHGPHANYSYCSWEHLRLDHDAHMNACYERRVKRSLVRVATLCAIMYIRQRMNLFLYDIQNARVFYGTNTRREITLTRCEKPRDGRKWWPGGSLAADILGAICFDNCIKAMVIASPLLAWTLRGT
jgi:hypothetical protein